MTALDTDEVVRVRDPLDLTASGVPEGAQLAAGGPAPKGAPPFCRLLHLLQHDGWNWSQHVKLTGILHEPSSCADRAHKSKGQRQFQRLAHGASTSTTTTTTSLWNGTNQPAERVDFRASPPCKKPWFEARRWARGNGPQRVFGGCCAEDPTHNGWKVVWRPQHPDVDYPPFYAGPHGPARESTSFYYVPPELGYVAHWRRPSWCRHTCDTDSVDSREAWLI